MAKRDWAKDHAIRKTGVVLAKDSLNDLIEGSGKPLYSQQLKQYVSPTRGKRIDPHSAEGQAIVKRLMQI